MSFDDHLHDVLSDDAWALPVPADALDRVRHGRAVRRRRTAVLSATGCAVVLAGGALLVSNLGTPHRQVVQLGAGPSTSAAPGIAPPFTPSSGRDWLLTSAQFATYYASHTHPSPGPGQSVVASPAPLGPQSAALLADVNAAGLPAQSKESPEDSVGGQPGAAAVHITLPSGIPVEVEQIQLQEPYAYDSSGATTDGNSAYSDATVVDVSGTTSAAAVLPHAGYGFAGYPSDHAISVQVVTQSGLATSWYAPSTVSLDDLKAWALAAAHHQAS